MEWDAHRRKTYEVVWSSSDFLRGHLWSSCSCFSSYRVNQRQFAAIFVVRKCHFSASVSSPLGGLAKLPWYSRQLWPHGPHGPPVISSKDHDNEGPCHNLGCTSSGGFKKRINKTMDHKLSQISPWHVSCIMIYQSISINSPMIFSAFPWSVGLLVRTWWYHSGRSSSFMSLMTNALALGVDGPMTSHLGNKR